MVTHRPSAAGKKRKLCILKKAMELSILCDVKACVILQNPDGKFETWPENRTEVEATISAYFKRMKEGEKFRKLKGQKSCNSGEKTIGDGAGEGNSKNAFGDLDDGYLDGLSRDSRKTFLREVESKIKEIDNRNDFSKNSGVIDNEHQVFDEISQPENPSAFVYDDLINTDEIFPEFLQRNIDPINIGDYEFGCEQPPLNILNGPEPFQPSC